MDIARENSTRTKRLRVLRRWAILAVIGAIGAIGFCYLKPAPPALSRSQAWIDSVRRGTLRVQVRGSGVLTPEDIRWIPATTDGRIENVIEEAGVAVHPDTILIAISKPELLQAAHDAELQLGGAEAELRTRQFQIERDLLSQEAVTAAARADYEEARLRAA